MSTLIKSVRAQMTPKTQRQSSSSSAGLDGDQATPGNDQAPIHHQWTLMRMLKSYSADWVLVFGLWFILSFLERIGGHKRHFSLTDISIQHPLVSPETVGPGLLLIISFLLPLLFTLLISLFIYRSKWDAHNSTLGVFTSFTITGVVTQIIKMGVGRPRPHTISVCQPEPGARDSPVWGLSDWTICTTEDRLALDDTFKSFPSGHSSLSFAGMGFLTWYIMGKLHVGDRRGYRTRAWLSMAPLLASSMVAVSRTADNRHHWQDVTVGSLLGLGISYVAYRAYYPALSHPSSHLPLAPRDLVPSELGDDEDQDQGIRLDRDFRDEEEGGRREGGGSGERDDEGMDDRVVPRVSEERGWRD